MALSLRKADKSDIEVIKDLLSKNDLPNSDVGNDDVFMFMSYENSKLIGIIGLEIYDDLGFLRSMVIDDPYRGKGYGRTLCQKLLEYAKSINLNEIYLLSKDAADFFEHIGFIRINRDDAPDAIKKTRQFGGLCPTSASLLKKSI